MFVKVWASRAFCLALAIFISAGCTPGSPIETTTTSMGAAIVFDGRSCSGAGLAGWRGNPLDVINNSTTGVAVVFGTYAAGHSRADLLAYGSDVSTRPDFIDALEIFEVDPSTAAELAYEFTPGTYFLVCMPNTNTMVVLDDVVIP
jgi:hypothetical protein